MRSEGYSTWSVCPSVCLSITTFSATTCSKPAKKQQQLVQRYTDLFLNMTIFSNYCALKLWREKPSERANMVISTGLLPRPGPLALCILNAHEVTTKGVYRLPHAIYCCSSPCQTLRELLVGDHE